MYALKFKEKVCATCPSADCLLKCQYMSFSGHKEAHGEMMKVVRGEESRVLSECATCYYLWIFLAISLCGYWGLLVWILYVCPV